MIDCTQHACVIGGQIIAGIGASRTNGCAGASQAVNWASIASIAGSVDEVAALAGRTGEVIHSALFAGSTAIDSIVASYTGPVGESIEGSCTIFADHTGDGCS